MKTYRCSICDEDRPANEFYVWKNGRRRQECTNCKRIVMIEYRHRNREHTNLTAKLCHNRARKERPADLLIHAAKQRAIKNNLPFDLKSGDLTVPEFCPAIGIKLQPNIGGVTGSDNSPSIDRIIP